MHCWRRLRQRHDRRDNVAEEREHDQPAVAELVHHQASDDDAEAETGEAGAADHPELRGGELKLGCPGAEHTVAEGEAYAGGEDRGESGPEEPFGVSG